jgi:hypothetical protein
MCITLPTYKNKIFIYYGTSGFRCDIDTKIGFKNHK